MEPAIRYHTNIMGDAAYLKSLGIEIQAAHPRGEVVSFEFALDPAEAERLLEAPERKICARYQQALRSVRRLIDMTLYSGKIR